MSKKIEDLVQDVTSAPNQQAMEEVRKKEAQNLNNEESLKKKRGRPAGTIKTKSKLNENLAPEIDESLETAKQLNNLIEALTKQFTGNEYEEAEKEMLNRAWKDYIDYKNIKLTPDKLLLIMQSGVIVSKVKTAKPESKVQKLKNKFKIKIFNLKNPFKKEIVKTPEKYKVKEEPKVENINVIVDDNKKIDLDKLKAENGLVKAGD